MPDPKREFKTVPRDTWRKMLRLAHTLDVEKGGLYDARSGCINVWVSPEDHPTSWDGVAMTDGAFPQPREYLGGIMAELTEDLSQAVLTLEVTPYDRMPQRELGKHPPPEEDEWAWVSRKAQDLLELAERLLEPPGSDSSIFCKFCEAPVKVRLFNDFLEHLAGTHQMRLAAVVLGDPTIVLTNIGPVEV
jgi:hypothetical protein